MASPTAMLDNLFELNISVSEGDSRLFAMQTDEINSETFPTCMTCDQPVVHDRRTGSWFHLDSQGHRLRHQGHPAKGPCRTPGKKRYRTAREAAKDLDGYRSGGVMEGGRPYYCGACRSYHVTSQSLRPNGKKGRASGTLVHDPKLRQYLEELGRQQREREGR